MAVKRQVPVYEAGVIYEVDVDSIKEWKDNPRKNEAAVPKLAALLSLHGQRSPVVCDLKTKIIYKGNTTWKAIKYNKTKTIKVLFQHFSSETAAIAYGISDNKASEFAEWDAEALHGMLEQKEIFPFSTIGFTEKEVDGLLFSANISRLNRLGDSDVENGPRKLVLIVKNPENVDELRRKLNLWVGRMNDAGLDVALE